MQRRTLLKLLATSLCLPLAYRLGATEESGSPWKRKLLLVELKGGNDGLNTVIPYEDSTYYQLRPELAIPRGEVLPLRDGVGLHPALAPLLPLWTSGGLAVIQGVGYPAPNLSHFRSIEIWETGSAADEYREEGWLVRAFDKDPPSHHFAAEGIVVDGRELGPLVGGGSRVLTLKDLDRFEKQAKHVESSEVKTDNPSLAHILAVEAAIEHAADELSLPDPFSVTFPSTAFGKALHTACRILAADKCPVVVVSLGSFDTHTRQAQTHERLLAQLAEGLNVVHQALSEAGQWDNTLVSTYSEFGRRPAQNRSGGTDHGTAAPHLVLGGKVKGGLFGTHPDLKDLSDGNLKFTTDYRQLYATILERWWNIRSAGVLGDNFEPLGFV